MILCPVDLAVCARAGCRGGLCEMAGVAPLLLCWECGAVEAGGVAVGLCVPCLRNYVPQPVAEEN